MSSSSATDAHSLYIPLSKELVITSSNNYGLCEMTIAELSLTQNLTPKQELEEFWRQPGVLEFVRNSWLYVPPLYVLIELPHQLQYFIHGAAGNGGQMNLGKR